MTSETAIPQAARRHPERSAPACCPPAARTTSAGWVSGLLDMFAAEGLDVAALVRDIGFDTAVLADPDARVPTDPISVLWELAVARSGKPALGLRRDLVAAHARVDAVGHAMASSAHLRDGVERLARYMAVISDTTSLTLEPAGADLWLSMSYMGVARPVPRQRTEYSLLTVLMECQWITRRELRPRKAEFVFPAPADDSVYREAFGCPLRFGQPADRLLLADADLRAPIPSQHRALAALHERVLDDRMAHLGQTSVGSQVCAEIARRLPDGEPRRQDVAAGLGLAERTLQRRLQAEGSAYQALLDRTRRELAQQYLADRRLSLAEVSDLLGFIDTSNFFRACRRWFGLPPAQYRARLWQTP